MADSAVSIELSDGEVQAWVEQGETVHLKAVDAYGDPVELTSAEAKALAEALLRFWALIEGAAQ